MPGIDFEHAELQPISGLALATVYEGLFTIGTDANNRSVKVPLVAVTKPAIIGDNGNWFIWSMSANGYVDSGKPSRGARGAAFTYADFTQEQLAALKGATGDPGVGVRSSVISYGQSDTQTNAPSSWLDYVPAIVQGKWLWSRLVITYTDNSSSTVYGKMYFPLDGSSGQSAYQQAVAGGYTGTEAQFIQALGAVGNKYEKPPGGIPSTDLAQAVRDSLGRADTALQQHQDISGKVDKVTGKGLSTNDYDNAEKAKVASALQPADLAPITEKIPSQASAQNQLADKEFVNSSISTSTAEFRGTYTSVSALQSVQADANDYAFVISTDADGNTLYNRYKYTTGSGWQFEFALNNSSFTAAQWAAIQSGITSALVTKLSDLPTNAALQEALQLLAAMDDEPTAGSNKPVKSGGILSSMLSVKTAQNLTSAQRLQAQANIGIVILPDTEYEALQVKDASKLYFTYENDNAV